MSQQQGVIKFFNESKGYGFIVEDETENEIFVHASGLNQKPVRQNQKVTFETKNGKKGLLAVNVSILP